MGKAGDVNSLLTELERLSKEDPNCVSWHLKEGHLVQWLTYIGENGLAEMLKGVGEPGEAVTRTREYMVMRRQVTTGLKRKSRRR